jgi:hypothetical protein
MADAARDLLDVLAGRFPALSASRVIVTSVIVAGIVGFSAAKLLDNAEHAGLEKENRALSAQITLYEAKLKVGSPEEALRKFEQLEAAIEQLRPKTERRLTVDQKKDLAAAMAPIAKLIQPGLVITFEGNAEEARFMHDFDLLFQTLDVKTMSIVGYGNSPTERGVMVGLRAPDHPSDLALKFIEALRRGGITVTTTVWISPMFGQFPLDFDLFIGPN